MANIDHRAIPIKAIPGLLDKSDANADLYFRLPRFQRGIVWNQERKLGLIDSVINEYPMGSLLLYGGNFSGKKQEVDVVDGLQRASTLSDFVKFPLDFLRPDQVFDETFLNHFDKLLHPTANRVHPDFKRAVDTDLARWFKEVRVITNKSFNAVKLAQFIGQNYEAYKLGLPQDFINLLDDQIHEAIDRVSHYFDYKIPIVLYKGTPASVPEVFERINSLGKSLDKYEILASAWASEMVLTKNKNVRNRLEERYKSWIELGWDVENFDLSQGIKEDEANLHEYLLGLSQVLADQFPTLYRFQKDNSSANIAFVIATYAFGLRNSDMAKLPDAMPKSPKGFVDPTAFEAALINVSSELDNSLGALKLKLNKKTENQLAQHSQNQIVSLVASCLVSCYDTQSWKLTNKPLRDKICKSAPSHYIRDILDGAWAGSGDSRAFRLVWDENQSKASGPNAALIPSTYYHNPVSRSEFVTVFDNWNVEQLKKSQTDRPNTSKEAKIVLMMAYSNLVSFLRNSQAKYDIEHIYPVKHIKDKIAGTSNGWPISAIGNLTLLEGKLNKIKGANLLGDYLPPLIAKGRIKQAQISEINKYLIQPDYTKIVDDPGFGLAEFRAFCQKRAEEIRDLIAFSTGMS